MFIVFLNITLSSADRNTACFLWQYGAKRKPQKASRVTGQTATFC